MLYQVKFLSSTCLNISYLKKLLKVYKYSKPWNVLKNQNFNIEEKKYIEKIFIYQDKFCKVNIQVFPKYSIKVLWRFLLFMQKI